MEPLTAVNDFDPFKDGGSGLIAATWALARKPSWRDTRPPATSARNTCLKLRLTSNVRRAIARVLQPLLPTVGCQQFTETTVRLQGWSRERRIVIVRALKPTNPTPQDLFWETPEDGSGSPRIWKPSENPGNQTGRTPDTVNSNWGTKPNESGTRQKIPWWAW